MNIYVGNLSFSSSEDDLRALFEQFGEVSSAKVVMDRDTGRSRGFGFIEMPNKDEASNAMNELNGNDFQGNELKVNESQPKPQGGGFNRGGGRNGGGRGGFGGNNNRGGGGGGGGFNKRW